jgi:hypothetical protein
MAGRQLREEPLPDFASSFDPAPRGARRAGDAAGTAPAAALIAARLAWHGETGCEAAALRGFFRRSLGGERLAGLVDEGLAWLSEPSRLLAYLDESGRYRLTALGARAVRAVLPLEIAAGVGQLVRDLLQTDEEDRWLSRWAPLDHLIVLEIISPQQPAGRFDRTVPGRLDAWMKAHPGEASVLYGEWIRGAEGSSRADQLLGSLGITLDPEAARRAAHLGVLRAVVLSERGAGVPAPELERRWPVANLSGIEERWRDRSLWLLAALQGVLDTPCFYHCLREHCRATGRRVARVSALLRRLRAQIYGLQEHLKYCSPLGGVLRNLRCTRRIRIGTGTVRRLESAGVTSLAALAALSVDQLVEIGVRRDLARAISDHVRRRSR